jgi:hypothetical protein
MRKLQGLALKREDMARLIRYGLVGAASNLAGYLVYLAVTSLGTPPKVTMTLLYGVGASDTSGSAMSLSLIAAVCWDQACAIC